MFFSDDFDNVLDEYDNWENEGGFIPLAYNDDLIEWGYALAVDPDRHVYRCTEAFARSVLDEPAYIVYTRLVLPWSEF